MRRTRGEEALVLLGLHLEEDLQSILGAVDLLDCDESVDLHVGAQQGEFASS